MTQPMELFFLFLILSLTINLEFGYAGIPNFGKVLFVAVGAFVAGSLSYRLMLYVLGLKATDIFALQARYVPQIDSQLAHSPLMALGLAAVMLAAGGLLGGLVGFVSSYPAIRLREDYLGMLLLASGEFFNYVGQDYYPFLGGAQGMTSPDPVFDLGSPYGYSNLLVMAALALFAVGIYLYAERIGRSPMGRTLRAVRDNEVASESLGKNNVAIRRNVLIVGSALAGMAGVLWLFYQPYIEPGTIGSFNRTTFTFIPFVIVIMGGSSNNRGVLVGTIVYMAIIEAFSQGATFLISQESLIGDPILISALVNRFESMLIGVLLILILLRRPQGLIPEKATLTMSKAKLRSIAGSVLGRGEAERPPKEEHG